MCPGIAVAGGGGNGGGGSGNGAKNGKGKKGAGTKKGKKDPKGGKKGAKDGKGGKGKCGGKGASCSKCSKKPSAGEPVDIASGAVFVQGTTDLFLPGPLHLDWQRSYHSDDRQLDCGLGHGWSHTFGWHLERRGRRIIVRDGGGLEGEFVEPKVGEWATHGPWVLERTRDAFILGRGDRFLQLFNASADDPDRWLLAAVIGPGDNRIVLEHDRRGQLARIHDSAGRYILVEWRQDHIVGLSVPAPDGAVIQFARYTYDDRGNLTSVTDADGSTSRFTYHDCYRDATLLGFRDSLTMPITPPSRPAPRA
jgi:YD repeat-containing protein